MARSFRVEFAEAGTGGAGRCGIAWADGRPEKNTGIVKCRELTPVSLTPLSEHALLKFHCVRGVVAKMAHASRRQKTKKEIPE